MASQLVCTACKQTLRVKVAPPPGSRVVCYLCKSPFICQPSAVQLEPEPVRPAPVAINLAKPNVYLLLAIAGGTGVVVLVAAAAISLVMFVMSPREVPTSVPLAEVAADTLPTGGNTPAIPVEQRPETTVREVSAPPATAKLIVPKPMPLQDPSPESNQISGAEKSGSNRPEVVTGNTTPVQDRGPSLAFSFQPGMQYAYKFRYAMEEESRGQGLYTGIVTYTALSSKDEKVSRIISSAGGGQATGTAFVVSPEGYLLTCQHVVHKATKIEVTLQQRNYVAKVVAADARRDLAILKIEAGNLTAAPLGRADDVQLAQEVRAFGFPLSDVLGTSLKITRGSVSGIVEKGLKLLQIDASINPGNSGGPLVNNRGEVIGICSAGLRGERVTNVGFAVPIADAHRLLESQGISIRASDRGNAQEGTELARQLTPAIAYVKTTFGTSAENSINCGYSGFYSSLTTRELPTQQSGRVLVSREGEVISNDGDTMLPLLVGTFGNMVFDKLPAAWDSEWEDRQVATISVSSGDSGRSGRFGGYDPFRGRMAEEKVTVMPVVIVRRYRLGESNNGIQGIHKPLDIVTTEAGTGKEKLSISGNGRIDFDIAKGYSTGCEMKLDLELTRGNITARFPVLFSYKLHEVLTQEQVKQKADELRREAEAAARKQDEDKLPVNRMAKVKKILESLESYLATKDRKINIGSLLTELEYIEPVPEIREEVARAMEKCLDRKVESRLRSYALEVLENWGTEFNATTLIAIVKEGDRSERHDAIKALACCSRNQKAVELLTSLLLREDDRYNAQNALEKAGPAAEVAVLALINNEDEEVRSAVCSILAKIGTQKSIPALERLAQSKANRSIKYRAERALDEIRERPSENSGKAK